MTSGLLRRVAQLEAARPLAGNWHQIMLLPGQKLADVLANQDGPQIAAEDHLIIRAIVEVPFSEAVQ